MCKAAEDMLYGGIRFPHLVRLELGVNTCSGGRAEILLLKWKWFIGERMGRTSQCSKTIKRKRKKEGGRGMGGEGET